MERERIKRPGEIQIKSVNGLKGGSARAPRRPDGDRRKFVGRRGNIEGWYRRRRCIASSGHDDQPQVLECAGDLCKCRKSFESWRGLAQAEIEHDGDAGDTLVASTVERESEGLRAMHLTPEGGHAIASGEP